MPKRKPASNPKNHHIDRRADGIAVQGGGSPDDLLSTSDIAEWVGLSTQFFEVARHKGYGPVYVRISARCVRYKRSDVLEWLKERTHHSAAEYRTRAIGEA